MHTVRSDRRLAWLDALEAIAIFMVVFYHSILYPTDLSAPGGWFYYFCGSFLSPCVPLFFIANGFLLLGKPMDLHRHTRRTFHIFFLACVWDVLSLGIMSLLRGEFPSPMESFDILWRFSPTGIDHLWFLGALFRIYLFFPLLKAAYDHCPQSFLWFSLLSFLLIFGNILLNNLGTLVLTLGFRQDTLLYERNLLNMFHPFPEVLSFPIVYFCLGGLLARYLDRILAMRHRNRLAAITLVLSCLGLTALGILYTKASGVKWDNVFSGYGTVFTFFSSLSIFLLCLNIRRVPPLVTQISRNTLGIYLIHLLLIRGLNLKGLPQSLHLLSVTLLLALAVLLTSLGISLLMKKVPVLRDLVS